MAIPGARFTMGCRCNRVGAQSTWLNGNSSTAPLPQGMCLKCLDGDKTNTDPSNWKAIPRALLPRLNGRFGRDYDAAPAELKPTILAIAELEHQARTVRKGKEA